MRLECLIAQRGFNNADVATLAASQLHNKVFENRFRAPVWALCQYLFRMKVTKGRLSLPETAKCKEQIRCGNSVALLSEESIMLQTRPTVQA